ncbi:DEAD/DEAH box helicase [Desulfitobacterium metallireducens]|uniref:Helicase n=1 Tax=Desulfitobacterium metallireducens DSM 15288 TaxID=871968 RepID=W0E8I4_9FIRM|nr:DEAD/DEAH box helicase [Desulfitobacterium metallireducens]AHF07072.1 helicase [Desulfitobacterium metallireducens DSM 15288]
MESTASFEQIGIHPLLLEALQKEGVAKPTHIQEKAIPLILANQDVVGQSETGSGKTLAYLLPIFQKIDLLKKENQALILTPTHELALQVHRQIQSLSQNLGGTISSAALIGNVNITRQIEKLKEKPHILVGSAGRILELIQKKKISSQNLRTIVLDEADRLLDEKNWQTVNAVIKTTLKDRQLLLFSATLSSETLERTSSLLKEPAVLRVTEQAAVASTISHQYFACEQRDKFEVLRKLVRHLEPPRALIFINKSEEIEKTVEKLKFHGLDAQALSGSSQKGDRRKAMEDFRTGKVHLLVASDLAARGLDIKNITHIFNLDIPEDPQLYLHRVGRTGRAGQSGIAISLASEKEVHFLHKVENAFKISIPLKTLSHGKVFDAHPHRKEQGNRPQGSTIKPSFKKGLKKSTVKKHI